MDAASVQQQLVLQQQLLLLQQQNIQNAIALPQHVMTAATYGSPAPPMSMSPTQPLPSLQSLQSASLMGASTTSLGGAGGGLPGLGGAAMPTMAPQPTPEPTGLLFPTQYHLEQKRKKDLEAQMLALSMGMSLTVCYP